jgi:hypothetical protein
MYGDYSSEVCSQNRSKKMPHEVEEADGNVSWRRRSAVIAAPGFHARIDAGTRSPPGFIPAEPRLGS